MFLLALLLSAAISQEVYAPPPVRPYTPPSAFGRRVAEGDADATVRRRRPIAAPVALEAYRGDYESRPSDRELSYEQNVARASAQADALMGPLDGRWRVVGSDGETLLDLDLFDVDPGRAVEGAWSRSPPRRAPETGPAVSVSRAPETVVIEFLMDGRPQHLRLRWGEDGWVGVLEAEGGDRGLGRLLRRDRPVRLARPG